MQVTKKTGSLDIDGTRRGRVHFRSGAVTGAELSGERGAYQGTDSGAIADILYVLSTLDEGSFSVGPADGPEADGFAVEEVLGEVDALKTLEGEVVDAGLFEASGVRLVSDLGKAITFESEDWQVIVGLVQPFTFDFLEAKVGRGGAVRIFHTLHRLGVAEAIPADEETEFLDQLAGGLSDSGEPTWLEEVSNEDNGAKHVAPEEPEVAEPEPVAAAIEEPALTAEPDPEPEPVPAAEGVKGVAAPASTTLTDGVYDEIRRLRSKVADK